MSAKLMQAVQYNSYGGGASGLKHVEVPVPTPKNNEVLLKLEATSINPVDWKIQNGFLRPFFLPREFPHIPCTDVAGEVVEVGAQYGGGLAEFAVASESSIAARPSEVSAAEGSIPIAGLTARDALTKIAGVKLDGTGEPKNVLDLGADEVLDYKTPEGATLKSPSGRKYDAVVQSKKRPVPFSVTVKREGLEHLSQLIKVGKLKTIIDSKFPLSKAEYAWAKSIDGHAAGKIIVEL
ncbi:unnamed protein product [Trifolium pratense]|uniref:Uncharacterized protein n=1 Tax=Trifolium pratense TaxID=57577 RepID=A0ACB0KGB1_TRIPR|nr:unnamed protein product [Trifolium pratense]